MITDYGLLGKIGGYGAGSIYQKGKAADSSGVSFLELASAKAAQNVTEQTSATGMSFKDMWQTRFPGAYYHVMDGSAISQGTWDRNDFPFEHFFSNNVDESILNWTSSGVEPAASSSEVQSRWSSTAGKKAIIVPPALEEKMQNNLELAEKVMANVENFIATYPATPGCSYLIELDENGEISKYRVTSPGTITVSSSEFVEARKAREAKHAEYERIAEENAIKRKLQEQEEAERYYKSSITKKEASVAYEANVMTETVTDNASLLG